MDDSEFAKLLHEDRQLQRKVRNSRGRSERLRSFRALTRFLDNNPTYLMEVSKRDPRHSHNIEDLARDLGVSKQL